MQFLRRNNVAESSLEISGGSEPTIGRFVASPYKPTVRAIIHSSFSREVERLLIHERPHITCRTEVIVI